MMLNTVYICIPMEFRYKTCVGMMNIKFKLMVTSEEKGRRESQTGS